MPTLLGHVVTLLPNQTDLKQKVKAASNDEGKEEPQTSLRLPKNKSQTKKIQLQVKSNSCGCETSDHRPAEGHSAGTHKSGHKGKISQIDSVS